VPSNCGFRSHALSDQNFDDGPPPQIQRMNTIITHENGGKAHVKYNLHTVCTLLLYVVSKCGMNKYIYKLEILPTLRTLFVATCLKRVEKVSR
jgi:hypothetical protein